MSREIKFRVWDGTAMYDSGEHPDFTLCDFASMTNPSQRTWMEENEPDFERYKLMQFTGLKDRNGKEIYEGDLSGDQYESGCVQWCDTCHGWSIGIAMIEGHCHQCDGDFMWLDFVDDVRQEKVEIVGNRFENPELIPA